MKHAAILLAALLLAPLAATKVTGIKLNHGGTSLSLRVDFASGARAASGLRAVRRRAGRR